MKKKANSSGTRSAFVRSIDSAARTLEAVASTEAIDSFGTILRCAPESVDLTRFNANPVLLAFHNDNAFPVGQCLNVRVEGGQLLFTASFDDITDADREVWAKYEARTMRGFSVRFIATEQQTTKIDGRDVLEYTKWELLEISCVPIPANPEALRRSAGGMRGNVKRSDMMKGLKAIGEGDGSDEEKKEAAALYETMGGDDGLKAAEEAESKDGGEGESDEDKAKKDEDAKAARAAEEEAEKEKSARAAVKTRATTSVERESALALQVRKLVDDAAAEKETRAVADLVAANLDKIPPSQLAWARSTSLDVLRGYLRGAPKHNIRAAAPAAGVRGETEGAGDALLPISAEDKLSIQRTLGIMPVASVSTPAFGAFDSTRGAKPFNAPNPAQARAAARGQKVS